MRKTTFKKICVTSLALFSFSLATLAPNPSQVGEPSVVQAASQSEVDVATLADFKAALKDPTVTKINVTASFNFKGNITKIPNRDLEINGNADKGVVINSGINSIYGKQNKKGQNLFSIKNANIVGDQGCGRFFTGGSGNGPSSRGWDVYAEGVTYTGARFVHLSEGKLTFGGTNTITTRAENAWVHSLEFLPNSVYNGIAANKDHGQFSAFYFNGRLVNCKAVGSVKIGENANVNVKIGPQSDKNYYYPVFYDKVARVDLAENAVLDVDAAGVAFQFIPRADYDSNEDHATEKDYVRNPVLNLAKNSKMYLNGRGGGHYEAMKLQSCGTQVNVNEGAELVVTGNSRRGAVRTSHRGISFNLNAPGNFEVANRMQDAKLFNACGTTINADNISAINYWNQDGGEYQTAPAGTFGAMDKFYTIFGKCLDSKTLFTEASDQSVEQAFQMQNYGKISLKGNSATPTPPVVKPWVDVMADDKMIHFNYKGVDKVEIYFGSNSSPILSQEVHYSETINSSSFSNSKIKPDSKLYIKGYLNGQLVAENESF